MLTHAAPTGGAIFSFSISFFLFTQHAERGRQVDQDQGLFSIFKYVFKKSYLSSSSGLNKWLVIELLKAETRSIFRKSISS